MTGEPRELQELGADARRAVALAEVEARALGHERVGTEHLLLGVIADEAGGAAKMLADAGATLAATRSKVIEAVGTSRVRGAQPLNPLPRTPRATRALARSTRFCHSRHASAVGSEHLLWGILDVEGTAGQVLRGLGLDVEQLRLSLEAHEAPAAPDRVITSADEPGAVVLPLATCPYCSAAIDNDLVFRTVKAFGEGRETRDALVFSCGACNRVLGVAPA